jgi:hypothetical protein
MTLPGLDDLIASRKATADCDTVHRPGGHEQPDWLALLTVAAQRAGQLQAPADDLVEDYVKQAAVHHTTATTALAQSTCSGA